MFDQIRFPELLLVVFRNSENGALILRLERCPTCSTCTGEPWRCETVAADITVQRRSLSVPFSPSYLTYIKLCTLVKRNESMAHTLHGKLKEPAADENKRGPRPQDLIRLYDIILQVKLR